MNPTIFAEWLRHQGHRVIHTKSSYWYNAGPRVYQAFPYHWLIKPDYFELSEFIFCNKVLGLRYSTPLSERPGSISYHAVYERTDYRLEYLAKWARKNVRRGLRKCIVEPISFNRLAEEGWSLQIDTLARQGRSSGLTLEAWRKCCHGAANLPGFTAWGALIGGNLAASVITFQMDDWVYMLYQQCKHEYLQDNVNNALSFIVTTHTLRQPGIKSILYGLHSLDAPPSVDEFKFRMGYEAKPVRQRVIFNPALSIFITPFSYSFLRRIVRCFPGNSNLAKLDGMVRFYLNGNRLLEQQVWPEILEEQRDKIFSN